MTQKPLAQEIPQNKIRKGEAFTSPLHFFLYILISQLLRIIGYTS